MQRLLAWALAIAAAAFAFVGYIFQQVIADFIKQQPQEAANWALKFLHAVLKFLHDLTEQTWFLVTASLLVGFVAGFLVKWLLQKRDGSRTKQRKALGFEMRSLGGHLRLSQLPIYEDRPQIMSCLATARKFRILVPDERVFEISKRAENLIMEYPIRNLIADYLAHVGTMLKDGHFKEAKQEAVNSKAAFAKAYAEHGAVVAQLAKPEVEPSAVATKDLKYELLTWFGIIGGALTLFGNLDGVLKLADWARLLVQHWKEWTHAFWLWAFSWLGIHVPPEWTPTLSFLLFGSLLTIGQAVKYNRTIKNQLLVDKCDSRSFQPKSWRTLFCLVLIIACLTPLLALSAGTIFPNFAFWDWLSKHFSEEALIAVPGLAFWQRLLLLQ